MLFVHFGGGGGGGQNKYCKICVEVNFKTLGGVFLILSQEADLEGACGACATPPPPPKIHKAYVIQR